MATRASRARATTGGRGSTTRARVGRTRDRRGRPARGAGRANANANANANAKKTDEGAKRTAKDAMEGLRPARARDGTKMVASVSTAAEARAREGTRGAGASAAAGAGVAVAGGAAAVALARASRGKKKSAEAKVLDRYAKIINDAYDIPFVPEFAESEVYREVCKAAYASAMKNLRQNLVGASVLGHPLIMSDYLDARHVPEKSSIKEQELAKFIDDVVGETSGIPVLLPGPLERKLYTNGVLTGWTVFEDTLKTFRLQLFDREFVFEVSSEEDGMAEGRRTKLVASGDGYLDIVPNLSNQTLRKIAREELKAPPPTNLFPHLQENVAKVAVGMLSEALTMEAKIKGFTVEFALEPYDDDTREAFANISFSDEDRLETQRAVKQLIEVCVDEYMDTRAMAISSVFLPRRIERDTYINLLTGLFGEIGKEPVLSNLGFNISMRVLSPSSGANVSASFDDDALTFDEGDAAKKTPSARDLLQQMGNEIRRGDFSNIASEARQILGVSIDGDEDPSRAARKKAQKQTREAISEFVDYLLRDPMYNVKAIPDNIERLLYINCFELIVDILSTVLSDFELDMLGRRIRMEVRQAPKRDVKDLSRFRPDARALREITKDFADIPSVQEIMGNVYAFVLAFVAQVASDFEVTVVGHRLNTGLSRRAEATVMESAGPAVTDALNESLVSAIEAFAQDVFAIGSRTGLNAGGSAETRSAVAIDFDKEVFALFEANASNPDEKFPFPYLNQEQFAKTIDMFIETLVPGAKLWDSHNATVQKIAKAADLNGDGVIQWAEWYYAAGAINRATKIANKKTLEELKGG